jgi:hypothetical protein
LVSFFDFIVGANHQMLMGRGAELKEGEEYDDVDFPRLLKESLNKSVLLLVWNIKAKEQRVVELVPSDNWGGAGLLGVTIKLDDYGGADERLVRVLEVDTASNGPAKLAGLIPQEDFLLGTTATTLTNTDVLASLLNHHLGSVVELYVYNSTTDLVRVVGLHPTYKWGFGESMLGAAVGTGYLHRLPQSCRTTIGKSVERMVRVSVANSTSESGDEPGDELNESNIQMEGTLELEVDEDGDDDAVDGDVGLAYRGIQVQPHRLGTPQPQTQTPQQQQQQQKQQQHQEYGGFKPDPPSTSERAAAAAAVVAQQRQHYQDQQHQQQPLAFSAADNKPTRRTPTIKQPEQQQQPSSASNNNNNNTFPPPPPFPQQQQQRDESSGSPFPPPPPLLQNIQEIYGIPPPFPDAAPIKPERIESIASYPPSPSQSPPTPTQQQQHQPQQAVVFPPPPPPPGPPSPDPPGEGDGYGSEEGSEYTDEEGSEYSDDDEEPKAPKSGGFFGFMAPPPKMEY